MLQLSYVNSQHTLNKHLIKSEKKIRKTFVGEYIITTTTTITPV